MRRGAGQQGYGRARRPGGRPRDPASGREGAPVRCGKGAREAAGSGAGAGRGAPVPGGSASCRRAGPTRGPGNQEAQPTWDPLGGPPGCDKAARAPSMPKGARGDPPGGRPPDTQTALGGGPSAPLGPPRGPSGAARSPRVLVKRHGRTECGQHAREGAQPRRGGCQQLGGQRTGRGSPPRGGGRGPESHTQPFKYQPGAARVATAPSGLRVLPRGRWEEEGGRPEREGAGRPAGEQGRRGPRGRAPPAAEAGTQHSAILVTSAKESAFLTGSREGSQNEAPRAG